MTYAEASGSWMAGQNVSLTIIGKVLGHKTPQATAVYARLAMDPQRLAMEGATTAMLTAGKQTKLLTIDAARQQRQVGRNRPLLPSFAVAFRCPFLIGPRT